MSEELTSSYFQNVYFPVKFFGLGFSTEFPSLYLPSLLSLPPERHRRKHCLINMFMRCFPSGSKFPVNFNWEWGTPYTL